MEKLKVVIGDEISFQMFNATFKELFGSGIGKEASGKAEIELEGSAKEIAEFETFVRKIADDIANETGVRLDIKLLHV